MRKKNTLRGPLGMILIYELLVIFIFSTVMIGILASASQQVKILRSSVNREQALQIAEAGVNYYQWHLAHFPTDFQDGTGGPGPYIHDYVDKDTSVTTGRFSLTITAPLVGSTIVTIQSTGYTLANPNETRTITTRYGIPSLAKYSLLTNGLVWIGSASSVGGPLHSNNGIRFDGTGNAPITSARDTYSCPASQGSPCPATQPGIWGSAPQSTRNFWQFPVPAVDFSTMTSDLATIKSSAQALGIYLPPSSAQGYSLVFNNNSTVSVYKVNSLRTHATGWDQNGVAHNEDLDYNTRTLQFTQALPTNGQIFIEDRTWVEGQISGRVLVAAARLPYNPSTAPSILVPNNITYTAYDGSVNLGLLAQADVLITYFAPNTLNVDAALVAQNGSVQRYNFPGNMKNTITLYGTVITYGRRVLYWVGSSGYPTITTIYDTNLLYSPPPSFPLSSSGYQQITWTSN